MRFQSRNRPCKDIIKRMKRQAKDREKQFTKGISDTWVLSRYTKNP